MHMFKGPANFKALFCLLNLTSCEDDFHLQRLAWNAFEECS